MPKARSSLTGRVRKPPASAAVLDPIVKKCSTTVVKKTSRKKPTVVLDLSDEEQEEEKAMSEKKKGKRKAGEPEPGEVEEARESSTSLKVHLFESSTARSTVTKTWKPLSAASKDELRELTKQVENEMKSCIPSGVSKSEFKALVERYMESLMKQLDTLQVPPFPSTLKPRSSSSASTSKDSIDLLDAELVKKKIESTQRILEKEEKSIREFEEELQVLKRKRSEEDEEANALGQSHEEDERPISLPVKKRKKTVTIESDPVASPPPKPKSRSKKSKPLLVSTKPASKSILKPPRPPPVNPKATKQVQDSDDFDSFPGVVAPIRSAQKSKSKSKEKEKTTIRRSAIAPKKRPSLAGKNIKT